MIPLLSHSGAVRGTSREVSGGGPPALDTGCRHAPVRGSVGAEGLGFCCVEQVEGEPGTVSVRRAGHLSAPHEGSVADGTRGVLS